MHQQDGQQQEIEEEFTKEELIQLQYIAKAMNILEKFAPWKPLCYNRALTAKKLLSSKNIVAAMHIGFRKKEGLFDGHAWITYKGTIITGHLPNLQHFQKLKPLKI